MSRLLLIDDHAGNWEGPLNQRLGPLGFELKTVTDPAKALNAVRNNKPDVVLLDLHFPGDDMHKGDRTTGGVLLKSIRREFPSLPVVIFTSRLADGDVPREAFAVQPHALFDKSQIDAPRKRGEPWAEKLAWSLNQAIALAAEEGRDDSEDLGLVVGQTEPMRRVAAAVRNASRHSVPVLISGESGTGKRDVASAIHRLSGRTGRFERVNGASLDAFALREVLESAQNGALLIENIQALPDALQQALLERIENCPSGVAGAESADVRLVVSIKQPLATLAEGGLLREDLAYSLRRCKIHLPPLRERMDDLPALFEHLIGRANRTLGPFVSPTLRPEVLAALERHNWPGNVRELASVIEQAVLSTRSNVLSLDDIEVAPLPTGRRQAPTAGNDAPAGLPPSVYQLVKAHVDRIDAAEKGSGAVQRYKLLKDIDSTLRPDVMKEVVRRVRKEVGSPVAFSNLETYFFPNTTVEQSRKDGQNLRGLFSEAGVSLQMLESIQ